jgi:hypothetical protein
LGWCHNHGKVDWFGDISHPRVCLDTEDACVFQAHRIHGPAKGTAYQTPQHGPPYTPGSIGGANYCDRLRMEDGVQRLSFGAQYIVSAIMEGFPGLVLSDTFGRTHSAVESTATRHVAM